MSESPTPSLDDLAADDALRVHQQCTGFEATWRNCARGGKRPVLEDWLVDVPPSVRAVLLNELLHLDLEYRRKAGERPVLAEYLTRFSKDEGLLRRVLPETEPVDNEAKKPTDPNQAHLKPTQPIVREAKPTPVLDQGERTMTGAALSTTVEGGRNAKLRLPGYEILGELGRGGMGVVYKARQLKLNRVVALKMILPGSHAGEGDLTRFQTEVEAIARLLHPNIVQVYEVGEHEGSPFFSLEFCRGGSLASTLRGTPIPAREAAALVETLACAMQVAHDNRVIHRDLKPANVLLTEEGMPKITDFGLAKKLDEAGQTQSGDIMGTPSYMAPEQAGGKKVGPLADVYALGAILYECLTGRPPFKAATVMDTIMQVVKDEPVPLSRLQSTIPRDLETICLKCLRKEPDKRYDTAAALAEDLRRWQAGEPVAARPVGRLERAWRWARRNPAMATASGLGVLLLTTLIVVPIAFAIAETQNSNRLTNEKGKTEEALKKSRINQQKAEEAERAALRQAAASILDRALSLCEQGEQGRGLLWMTRGLELAQRAGDAELEDTFRWNIGTWSAETHQLAWMATCPGAINCVALSPDNKLLAACGWEKEVRLLQTDTGKPFGKPLPHPGKVWSVAFHPNGQLLLTGCEDGIARLWNIETGQVLEPTMLHYRSADSPRKEWPFSNGISSVAFSPDGKIAATGGFNNTVRLWSIATCEPIGSPLVHAHVVHGVAFSPDGRTLATGGVERKVHLWKVETGQEDGIPLDCPQVVFSVAFSPDGNTLLTAQLDSQLLRWNIKSRSRVGLPLKHLASVFNVTALRDTTRIVSVSEDQTVRIWNAVSGQQVGPALPHSASIKGLAASSDCRFVVSGSEDGSLRLWKIAPSILVHTLRPGLGSLRSAAFSPDGNHLLVGGDNVALRWDVTTAHPLSPTYRNPPGDHFVLGLAFSPNGKILYTVDCENEVVHRWDTTTGRVVGVTTEQHGDEIWRMALSPDGTTLLTGAIDYRVEHRGRNARLWDAESGKPIGSPLRHLSSVYGLAFSSDSKSVLTGSHDRTTRLWDAVTGEPLGPPVKHSGEILAVAFRPDGKGYLTGGGDRNVRQWDQSWNPVGAPMQHNGVITSISYSSNARFIFSSSTDGTARVWHTGTGKPIGPAMQHTAAVNALVHTPDKHRLATCSADGHAKIWMAPARADNPVAELLRRLELHTGLTLDAAGTINVLEEPDWRERCLLEETDTGTVPPPPPKEDPDRIAAEWVMSIGGTIKVNDEDREIKAVADLPSQFFRLTVVSLSKNKQVSHADMAHFKDCKNLMILDLSDTRVSDAGLANFKDCKSLMILELRGTQVSDVGLANFKDCNNLHFLDLQNTQVTDVGLANFKNCKKLTYLDLRDTRVSDAGLANFKDCKGLVQLLLDKTRVSDAGLHHFKDCKNLTLLHLWKTKATDAGLADFKDCKNLTVLALGSTQVSDAGLAHFKDCKGLTTLWLEKTQVSDECLAQLMDCKNLSFISIRETKVTAAKIEELKKALPNCKIDWDGK